MNVERGLNYVRGRAPEFVGYTEVRREPLPLLKASFAEFFGTLFLVFVWTGATLSIGQSSVESRVALSLAVGFIVASMVKLTENVSGGHLNPAVTVGFLAGGQINLIRAVIFIVVQILGGIAGTAILKGVSRRHELVMDGLEFNSTVMTPQTEQVDLYQTLGIEFLSTTIFVLVILSVRDRSSSIDVNDGSAWAIGVSISACHLAFINFVGLSMNPARSLGPAVITRIWDHHWIYWVGPIIGGIVAALLHLCIFKQNPPRPPLSSNFVPDDFEMAGAPVVVEQSEMYQEAAFGSGQNPSAENIPQSSSSPASPPQPSTETVPEQQQEPLQELESQVLPPAGK